MGRFCNNLIQDLLQRIGALARVRVFSVHQMHRDKLATTIRRSEAAIEQAEGKSGGSAVTLVNLFAAWKNDAVIGSSDAARGWRKSFAYTSHNFGSLPL